MTYSLKFLFAVIIAFSSLHVTAQKAVTIAFDPLTTVALGGYEVEAGFK